MGRFQRLQLAEERVVFLVRDRRRGFVVVTPVMFFELLPELADARETIGHKSLGMEKGRGSCWEGRPERDTEPNRYEGFHGGLSAARCFTIVEGWKVQSASSESKAVAPRPNGYYWAAMARFCA